MKVRHRSHPVFDVESEIVKAGNQPSPVDLAPFQKELNRIAGLDVSGRPNLRVVWGQDASNRMIVCGSWRMRHPFWRNVVRHERVNPVSGLVEFWDEMVEIGVPRFFVEELHTNAELKRGDRWEKARFVWNGLECLDVLGPVPEEGFYTDVFLIAYHDELCCGGSGSVRGDLCLGAYRAPGEEDLERVRRMKWRRDHASADEIAPSDTLVQKRAEDASAARDEKWRSGIRQVIDDWFRTHSHAFATLDPAVQQHGKFKFLGGTSKSGLTEEERNKILRGKNARSNGVSGG
jgi:hypothetical protein